MHIPRCLECNKQLNGRQTKYCSRGCKNTHNNLNFQTYEAQQKRGRTRKLKLIKLKGGRCARCGYGKNHAALVFHHIEPENKSFPLELRSLSNRKWETILDEVDKCLLLCSNCHAEVHNPDAAM